MSNKQKSGANRDLYWFLWGCLCLGRPSRWTFSCLDWTGRVPRHLNPRPSTTLLLFTRFKAGTTTTAAAVGVAATMAETTITAGAETTTTGAIMEGTTTSKADTAVEGFSREGMRAEGFRPVRGRRRGIKRCVGWAAMGKERRGRRGETRESLWKWTRRSFFF